MIRKATRYAVPALALLPLLGGAPPRPGGWAVITVDDLPDYVVAGQPMRIRFAVRQHGMNLLPDLHPRVEARSGSASTTAGAVAATGRYVATVTLPKPGEWAITIHSGFGTSRVTLLPLRAIESAARVPAMPERERGRHLFVAKGCITCHVHGEAKAEMNVAVGPELTGRRYPADYLAKFLANPALATAARATAARATVAKMPNLELKEREIAALVAFLNSDRQLSARERAIGSP